MNVVMVVLSSIMKQNYIETLIELIKYVDTATEKGLISQSMRTQG